MWTEPKLAEPTPGMFGYEQQIFYKSKQATNKMVEGCGLPKNTRQNRSRPTLEWTAKVFLRHFEFYHFIPLSTQPCGMLIVQRAGGAGEITLQRWRLCYAQRSEPV